MSHCTEKGELLYTSYVLLHRRYKMSLYTLHKHEISHQHSLLFISWQLLNETIDELLKVNPETLIISSMERRQADGIDFFLEEMSSMHYVGSVEKVWAEEGRKIEIYITRGIS